MERRPLAPFAWPDRWVRIDARKAGNKGEKGWEWAWIPESRLAGGRSGRDVIAAAEIALLQSSGSEPDLSQVGAEWRLLLAGGPTEVER